MNPEPTKQSDGPIFLVNEDAFSLNYTASSLETLGRTLLRFRGPGEALKSVSQARPSLVLLDLDTSDADGPEMCREIVERLDYEVPVVLISSGGDEDLMLRAYEAGAADFLVKPIGMAELRAKVRLHLGVTARRTSRRLVLEQPLERVAPPGAPSLGRFVVLEQRGSTPEGELFRASDSKGRSFMITLLSKELSEREDLVSAYVRKAAELHALRPGAVASISEVGKHDGRSYLAREEVPGRELGTLGPLPVDLAVGFLWAAAEVVREIHSLGRVHGHLCASSFVVARERVVLVDFGPVGEPDWSVLKGAERDYVPPETLEGAPPSERGDVYGLGVLLTQLLTDATDEAGMARLPEDIRQVFLRLRARDPAERLQTVDDALAALRATRGEAGGDALPRITPSHLADLVKAAATIAPGRVIGGSLVDRIIGRGGNGVVYQAHHLALDKPVALKVLAVRGLGTEAVRQLVNEARIAARIEHPNVVQVYNVGYEDSDPYIVMQLVRGGNLAELVARTGPLPIDMAVHICRGAALGLAAAHHAKIVHRDVKPANLLLTRQGDARVTDFGVARMLEPRDGYESGVQGTPATIAPEQIMGKHVTAAADAYSLGVTFYYALTARFPFSGSNPSVVLAKHLKERPTPPRSLRPEIPRFLSALVMRLLEKDPELRPSDLVETANAMAPYSAVQRRLHYRTVPFGQLAVDEGYLQDDAVERALKRQQVAAALGIREPIGDLLVAEGALTDDERSELLHLQGEPKGPDESRKITETPEPPSEPAEEVPALNIASSEPELDELVRARNARTSVGSYRLIRQIASGKSGVVYHGQTVQGDPATIVLFHPRYVENPAFVRCLVSGTEHFQAIHHPALVRFLGVGHPEPGVAFLAREFVEGATLIELLRRRGPLPVDQALDLLIPVCEGLAVAAKAGSVHGDLGPSKILVDEAEHSKLIGPSPFTAWLATGRKASFHAASLAYLPPEKLASGRIESVVSDIYSVGAILFRVVSGKKPFGGVVAHEVIRRILEAQPVPLQVVAPDLPLEVGEAIERLMAKDPKDRHQTWQACIDALCQLRLRLGKNH